MDSRIAEGVSQSLPNSLLVGALLDMINPLPEGDEEHLTVEELTRNVCYAPKRINVIP
jgi:hypothetical protein